MRDAGTRSRAILVLGLLLLVVAFPLVTGSGVDHDDPGVAELTISAPDAVRAPVPVPRHDPPVVLLAIVAVLAAMAVTVAPIAPTRREQGSGPRRVGAGGLALRAPPVV